MYDRFYGFSAKLEMLSPGAEVDKLKEDDSVVNPTIRRGCGLPSCIRSGDRLRDVLEWSARNTRYLKGLMEGEAKLYLNNVEISEQGYKDAMRKLYLRYENNRQLIKCHIETLFDTPAMSRESADELLLLIDRFERRSGAGSQIFG
ncbi:hypothetical protein pipiens_017154 [Culex pipiens pipiens]|uniref:Uncharacterized protein n=1 Tax=Culex pipiens pipiens TaxID=38569 RepID=A0ABD1CHW7_CULPP